MPRQSLADGRGALHQRHGRGRLALGPPALDVVELREHRPAPVGTLGRHDTDSDQEQGPRGVVPDRA
jgi:hypothetical protein